jgi:hypothetical protein
MNYRFYPNEAINKNKYVFNTINKKFNISIDDYQAAFPNINLINDEFQNNYARNLAKKNNLNAIDIISIRKYKSNSYIKRIVVYEIKEYMKTKGICNTKIVSQDRCKVYNTTVITCECPAFKHYPSTNCKHIKYLLDNPEQKNDISMCLQQ